MQSMNFLWSDLGTWLMRRIFLLLALRRLRGTKLFLSRLAAFCCSGGWLPLGSAGGSRLQSLERVGVARCSRREARMMCMRDGDPCYR